MRLTSIIKISLLNVGFFIVGLIIAGLTGWNSAVVTLKIHNQTGAKIQNIQVACQSDAVSTTTKIATFGLGHNEIFNVYLLPTGSSLGCQVSAHTSNGNTITQTLEDQALKRSFNIFLIK